MTCWYSNQVEILFEKLKESLFTELNPFTRRMIVVPSPAMKSWLTQKLADDPQLGIALGLEITYLDQSISSIQKIYNKEGVRAAQVPETLELSLLIEAEIRNILNQPETDLWQPLQRHLSRKTDGRLVALSEKLAYLFLQYRCYGRKSIEDWKADHWQKELYLRLLGNIPWPEENLAFEKGSLQVHLFAKSFIPKSYQQFFYRLSRSVPVHFYLLSPCESFWSDILSDHESARLQSYYEDKGADENQLEELEQYLSDRNPLLANFGRLGREMAKQMELFSIQVREEYCEPDSSRLLGKLQSDMLQLDDPREPIDYPESDSSIQFHQACTRKREVEILYHNLLEAIKEDPDISANEMVVMAPNIVEYAPYIQAVFGSRESQLDFQMMDLKIFSKNHLVQGFMHLLELALSRWDVPSVLQLFDYSVFHKKHFSGEEDLFHIRRWIKETGVRWGQNIAHRNEVLKRSHCQSSLIEETNVGSWQHGMDRLMMGLVMDIKEKGACAVIPYEGIRMTQGELLGKLQKIFLSLKEDLRPLTDGTKLQVKEWVLYLKCLCEAYFRIEPEEGKQLFAELDAFPALDGEYSFYSIKRHLEAALSRKKVQYRENHVNAVRFCSMLPMRAIPAKVVALLGMNEGDYPRQEPHSSLNLLQGDPKADFCPSQTDFDRYLFLEALLSARKKLMISYQGIAVSDGKERPPSLVVQELMGYLDRTARIAGKKPSEARLVKHPFRFYDKKYFSAGTTLKSYLPSHYRAAEAFYLREKRKGHCFIEEFSFVEAKEPQAHLTLDFSEIASAAKNPVETYFKNTLGIYLKREEESDEEKKDFILTPLDAAILRKEALQFSSHEVLKAAGKEGRLPSGIFKAMAEQKMERETEELKRCLHQLGVNYGQICEIQFSDLFDEPRQAEEGNWQVPSLEIETIAGKVKIVGRLSGVSPLGLIHLKEDKIEEIIKLWPSLLILSLLKKRYQLPFKDELLFAKNCKVKSPFYEDPEPFLARLVNYTLLCRESISPLIPEWIPDLIKLEPEGFQKKMQDAVSESSKHFYNHHMRWILQHSSFPDCESLVRKWKPYAIELFGDVLQGMGKK